MARREQNSIQSGRQSSRFEVHGSTSSGPVRSEILSNTNTASYDFIVPPAVVGTVSHDKVTAQIVADSIVAFCIEHGDWITNQKLQKLLYYAQAWHLALHGRKMFPDDFQAWIHGPVQPEVYSAYAKCGNGPILAPDGIWEISGLIRMHIENVFEAYGHLTAFDLARLACSEAPWIAARGALAADEPGTAVIDPQLMKSYYKSRMNEQVQGKT